MEQPRLFIFGTPLAVAGRELVWALWTDLSGACFCLGPVLLARRSQTIGNAVHRHPIGTGIDGGLEIGMEPANPAAVKQVRLVQPVISQAEKWDRAKRGQHLSHIVRTASAKTPIPQLMIWPETAFSAFASRDGAVC